MILLTGLQGLGLELLGGCGSERNGDGVQQKLAGAWGAFDIRSDAGHEDSAQCCGAAQGQHKIISEILRFRMRSFPNNLRDDLADR